MGLAHPTQSILHAISISRSSTPPLYSRRMHRPHLWLSPPPHPVQPASCPLGAPPLHPGCPPGATASAPAAPARAHGAPPSPRHRGRTPGFRLAWGTHQYLRGRRSQKCPTPGPSRLHAGGEGRIKALAVLGGFLQFQLRAQAGSQTPLKTEPSRF